VDDGFVVFTLDNFASKGAPNPGPRQRATAVGFNWRWGQRRRAGWRWRHPCQREAGVVSTHGGERTAVATATRRGVVTSVMTVCGRGSGVGASRRRWCSDAYDTEGGVEHGKEAGAGGERQTHGGGRRGR
jgi:hypothetical protein